MKLELEGRKATLTFKTTNHCNKLDLGIDNFHIHRLFKLKLLLLSIHIEKQSRLVSLHRIEYDLNREVSWTSLRNILKHSREEIPVNVNRHKKSNGFSFRSTKLQNVIIRGHGHCCGNHFKQTSGTFDWRYFVKRIDFRNKMTWNFYANVKIAKFEKNTKNFRKYSHWLPGSKEPNGVHTQKLLLITYEYNWILIWYEAVYDIQGSCALNKEIVKSSIRCIVEVGISEFCFM